MGGWPRRDDTKRRRPQATTWLYGETGDDDCRALDPRLHEKLYGIPDEKHDRAWKLVHKAVADKADGTFVKNTAEHIARPVHETSSSKTDSTTRGSAPKTGGGR